MSLRSIAIIGALGTVLFMAGTGYLAYRAIVHLDTMGTARQENDPSVVACRASGAFPVFNAWDGRMVDCKSLPAKAGR